MGKGPATVECVRSDGDYCGRLMILPSKRARPVKDPVFGGFVWGLCTILSGSSDFAYVHHLRLLNYPHTCNLIYCDGILSDTPWSGRLLRTIGRYLIINIGPLGGLSTDQHIVYSNTVYLLVMCVSIITTLIRMYVVRLVRHGSAEYGPSRNHMGLDRF